MAKDDALANYNAKRDFGVTSEPKGALGKSDSRSFIVQKHDATRLHYDFRLEMEGVLKSWAVTKGPSLNPDDKRLAVRTEDHPIAYASFEGVIPKGEYGGGTVMLWDEGRWEPVAGKDPVKTLVEGHLHFKLFGHRMKGEWLLVRMKPRGKEKQENWLLRKIEDEAAGSISLVDTALTSVATGRTMAEIAAGIKAKRSQGKPSITKVKPQPSKRVKREPGGLPRFKEPQLATLVDNVPDGRDWIHEVKYDGYRCLIAANRADVRAFTRSGLDWSEKFASVVEAFRKLDLPACLVDGEIVAMDAAGRPSFSQLQATLKGEGGTLAYFAFDLLEQGGASMDKLPNVERKERLQRLLAPATGSDTVFYAEHVKQGQKLFNALCEKGYEGIISKKADAPYRGQRTRNWLKVKCTLRQEFVIIGFTASDKSRGFKSLLLGTWLEGKLHYAGKVGTGFTTSVMNDLLDRLRPLVITEAAAEVPKASARGARWVKPQLVAEVAYAEATGPLGQGGVLRHASYLRLRDDKPAEAVGPEIAIATEKVIARAVNISSGDRILFPEAGVTKQSLADYYQLLADPILLHLANRPISLVRCPQGRAKKCFFQKHDAGTFGADVHHVPITEKDGQDDDYLYVDSVEGILGCVQMGAIEFHGWGSRVPNYENPDRMVFDLDPDEGLDFAAVKTAALIVKDELAFLGLPSEAMLSGGKGIHVVVTLDGAAQWPAVKDFASRFANALAQAKPHIFTANIRKAERKGRIFIDWLRNQRGATAVQPWTVRARPGAPVAMPILWSELDNIRTAAAFSLQDQDALVERAATEALKIWGTIKQPLPAV
jgi:bifunctional non-homologous end joining protein LigD